MNFEVVKELLASPRKIVITTHKSPDGDALGSSLGLHHYLKAEGHEVQVITPNAYPKFLQWMPGNETVIQFEGNVEDATRISQEAEVIFSLDYNTLHRMDEYGKVVGACDAVKIMIDHHQEPDDFAEHILSETTASSTAQLIFDFIQGLGHGHLVTKDIAECLYAGIMTDTGSFRFSNTSANTHKTVAALLETGMKVEKVHQLIFDTNSFERLQLLGYALSEKLVYLKEFNTAYISLSLKELNRFQFRKGDTEGVVNYALSIEGVRFAALMTQDEYKVKLSLRSKSEFNVNAFSRSHFSGGGHLNAAGGMSQRTMEETVKYFEGLLPQYKKELCD